LRVSHCRAQASLAVHCFNVANLNRLSKKLRLRIYATRLRV
jgi:hypothetical protein